MNINLPSLLDYKKQLEAKGVKYPLNITAFSISGLLKELPVSPKGKIGWPWTEETNPDIYTSNLSWPKLTIVTPSYNQDQFLEQTIRSVLLQNYPNLEYIVIDGGSSDNSVAVLKKYAPWISYWQSEEDNGQSHAINQGFSLASGVYYAWLNSDDYYLKNIFYTVVTTFLNKKISFVYGYAYNFDVKEQQFTLVKTLPILDYFLRFPALAQPACFWASSINQPLWEDLHGSLDFELWQRLLKGQTRKLLMLPLAVANVHGDAKTHNPKMGVLWQRDHELICGTDAHGPVNDWARRSLLLKLFHFSYKLFEKVKSL